MLFLDVRKLPRPERSGVIAVLLSYVLVCALVEQQMYGTESLFSLPNLPCMIFPFIPELCPAGQTEVEAENEKPKEYKSIFIHFGHSPLKSDECSCHVDIDWTDKPLEHLRLNPEPRCDTLGPDLYMHGIGRFAWSTSDGWLSLENAPPSYTITIYGGIHGELYVIHHGEGRVRWHCEKSSGPRSSIKGER